MRRRHPSPNRAKSHRSYTVEEITRLYGAHKNTVRNWLSDGLRPNGPERPTMVYGTSLNEFHAARKAQAKRPCGPGELYCVRCRAPKKPVEELIEFARLNDKVWVVRGICPDCGRLISQRVNAKRRAEFLGGDDQPPPPDRHA